METSTRRLKPTNAQRRRAAKQASKHTAVAHPLPSMETVKRVEREERPPVTAASRAPRSRKRWDVRIRYGEKALTQLATMYAEREDAHRLTHTWLTGQVLPVVTDEPETIVPAVPLGTHFLKHIGELARNASQGAAASSQTIGERLAAAGLVAGR